MEQWFKEAKHDLELAKRFRNEQLHHVACFFAQQAAEKALKALYYICRRPHPRTHDLEKLYLELPQEVQSIQHDFTIKDLRTLTDYYEKSRYPDAIRGLPSEKIDREDADLTIEIAEKVISWVEKIIATHPIEDPDPQAIDIAREVVRKLKTKITVTEAYVFGSRVRGDWNTYSDLDIVIVSPNFKNLKPLERLKLTLNILENLNTPYRVNLFLYTPEEFKEALNGASPAIVDASKYWIRID